MARSLIKLIIHVVALTAVVVLVAALMPGVRFDQPSLALFLAIGFVLAVLNAILRPLAHYSRC